MSVMRGYFQAIHEMAPYAISQIIEQLARVFYMLLTTFIIMKIRDGNYVDAVTQSTFAAFIGAIAGMGVLIYYFQNEKVRMDIKAEHSQDEVVLDTKSLLVTTIKESIPFIIIGSGITIFKLIDQFTFIHTLRLFADYTQTQAMELLALFGANPDKLTMVVIGLAIALASVGLPLITEAYALDDRRGLARLISNNLQLYFFVMLPATFGMILLAYPLNTIFYEPNVLGTRVLIEASLSGLVLGLFMLTASMLQGMYENRAAVRYLLIGFLLKLVLQIPFIFLFEVYGPLLSTTIALSVTCYLNIRKLHEMTRFNRMLTSLMTMILIVLAGLTRLIFGQLFSVDHKGTAFLLVLIVGGIGSAVYIYMALKIRIADKLLGPGMLRLRRKLHIK